jgi:3-hydroxyisobutyrate dehydrogenase-like beta-hydroxyacid dehydrogenase
MAKVAFIGLGVMGFPMAGHLAAQGHAVTVFNRTPARAELWLSMHQGRAAPTPAAAAEGAEYVFTCVGNDQDLLDVTLGAQGALATMSPGSVLIDNTTASADAARSLYQAAKERGVYFLDAPVSGGQAGAENGKLTVMVGGDQEAYAAAEAVIASFARAVTYMGPTGAGQLTKMVNQICIAGLVQALSEGLAFAEKAGLDGQRVIDVISKGAAQSWQMENRGCNMLERKFDYGFAVDWMRKDLAICFAEAQRNGSRLPVTQLVDQFYAEVQKKGGSRFDTSSLMMLLTDDEPRKSS